METVTFISLMVDYKVPPTNVLDAINEEKLRPIISSASLSTATLKDISFERSEVETVFWRQSFEWRSAEEKAELERRFQSRTALVSAIIGAVVGSAASRLVEPPHPIKGVSTSPAPGKVQQVSSAEDSQFQIDPMPAFQEPVNTKSQEFWLAFASTGITYTLKHDGSFVMHASADGVRMPPWRNPHPELAGVMLGHGSDWFTVYEGRVSAVIPIPKVDQFVRLGDPVLEVRKPPMDQVRGYFSIWVHRPGGRLTPFHPAHLNWPILPRMPE